MYFKDLLKRAELESIKKFIISGDEIKIEPSAKAYAERIAEASERIGEFFDEYFPDMKDQDRICSIYDKQMEVYQDVYFGRDCLWGKSLCCS